MPIERTPLFRLLSAILVLTVCALLQGCPTPYEWRHENQWDAREQIGLAEASQVKLRVAQSRVFDTVDSRRILEAVVSTMQDLNFEVQVLDEELGLVSGKLLVPIERPDLYSIDGISYNLYNGHINSISYNLYNDQSLLLFSRNYNTWGPFWHRDDLVRLTVTVRKRSETQSVVRASVQFYLQAVENPEPYQKFFSTLGQTLFLEAQAFKDPG